MDGAGLGEQIAMVAQRRRLRVTHALEPVQIGVCHGPERRRRVGRPLRGGRALGELALYLPHEPILRHDRHVLVQVARLRSAPPTAQPAGAIRLEPCRPEPSLHRPEPAIWKPVAPAGLVDDLAVARRADDQPGGGRRALGGLETRHGAPPR